MSAIRIAHIVDGLGIGGAEQLISIGARALDSHDAELVAISLRKPSDGPVMTALRERGIEVIPAPSHRKRSFADQERRRRLRAILEGSNIDVVQTHLLYANVVGTLAAHDAGIPSIATLHQTERGLRRFEVAREYVESAVVRRYAARVVAVGSAVAEANRRRFGRVPIDIVPNPVSAPEPITANVRAALRAEMLQGQPGPLLLAVGRLETVKGFDDLITALAAVVAHQPGAVLAIAGNGSLRDALTQHARRLGLERHVRLLGKRADVGALLSVSDLFVMSSRSEGLPFALLEAMVAGVPVVATRVGDIPSVLGSAGMLVAPGDPTAMAAALTQALGSDQWRAEQSAVLQQRAYAGYSEQRWAHDMMRLYRATLDSRGIAPKRQFKVAVLTHGYKPRIGGIESQRASTTPRLRDLGIEPYVFTRPVPGTPAVEMVDGVCVRRLKLLPRRFEHASMSRLGRPVASIVWSTQCLWHLLRIRPNVIHADEVLSTARVGLAANRLLGIPVVVFAHGYGPIGDVDRNQRTASGRRLLEGVRRNAALIVSVNDQIDEEFARLGVEPERRLVMPNGVDIDYYSPATAGERDALRAQFGVDNRFVAVFTGRLSPEKRVDRSVAVWRDVADAIPGATLFVVGQGPEEPALRAAASENVRFFGETDDVRPYLRAADAFVLTSDLEGVSCSLLEAQASGLPAVVTDVGAARQVVNDGETGFVVERDDVVSLRECLRALGSNPTLATTMGSAARNSVVARFSLEETVKALRSVYMFAAATHNHGEGSHGIRVDDDMPLMRGVPCSK
jgi:glycosyltransferase involved in cell wall biosynthesis